MMINRLHIKKKKIFTYCFVKAIYKYVYNTKISNNKNYCLLYIYIYVCIVKF